MRLIAVDLEMCQPSTKIIQIGAICFQSDNGSIVEVFDQLVDPGESITQEITDLTGIKNEDVAGKPNIVEAANNFNSLKTRLQANPIGIVWGAGRSNDVQKIYDESGVESAFRGRILDVKGVFNMLANASNAQYRQKVGLRKALELVGMEWDSQYGPQHNAVADAYNTMKLYMFLSKCLKGGVDIKLG